MSYDIAIGRCTAFDEDSAIALIEGAMLAKLDSTYRFRGPSRALLKVTASVCSKVRTPVVGRELYIDSDAAEGDPPAFLDARGDGNFQPVSLRLLLSGPPPGDRPISSPRATNVFYRIR